MRERRFSLLFIGAVLSPALLQPVDCEPPTGDTTLSSLTVELDGTSQLLGFTTSDRAYDVWNPTSATSATITAFPTDGAANVILRLGPDLEGIGNGGGTTTIDIPAGSSRLFVEVRPSGGAIESYVIDIDPACNAGSCDDGNECTDDAACDIPTNLCPPPAFLSNLTLCGGGAQLCDGAGSCAAVGSQRWAVPHLLDSGTNDVLFPQVAVDASGNAFAVWSQTGNGVTTYRTDIWASRFTPGAGWSASELLETSDYKAEAPQVGVDGAGNAIAIWQQTDRSRFNVWTNRYEAGSGWLGPQLLETEDCCDSKLPNPVESASPLGFVSATDALAVSTDGSAFAVWTQDRVSLYRLKAARYDPIQGWAAPVELDPQASGVTVGVDANGNAIAVWWRAPNTLWSEFWSSRFVPGVGWDAPVRIVRHWEFGSNEQSTPRLAVDASGSATVAWRQACTSTTCGMPNPVIPGVWAVRYEVATGWGTPQQVDPEDAAPSVAAGGTGEAFVVWRSVSGITFPVTEGRLMASRYGQGAWEAPVAIFEGPGGSPADISDIWIPEVAANAAGDAVAAWGALTPYGGGSNARAARYIAGTGWQPHEVIENNEALGDAFAPAVASGADGSIMCVFIDGNASYTSDLWGVRFNP